MPGFEDIEDDNTLPSVGEDDEDDDIFPGFDMEDDEDEDVIIPEVEEDKEDNLFEDNQEDEEVNKQDNDFFANDKEDNSRFFEEEQSSNNTLPNLEEQQEESVNNYQPYRKSTELESYESKSSSIEGLLTNNQKIVAFVGTSKNGTSFLVNNLAEILSKQGIKTAILDLTKNKNSYYIYTKNEESLRKAAFECMPKSVQGVPQGIKVNNNLDVYTALPGEDEYEESYQEVLETLVKTYSLVLIDCDFKTNYAYLKEANEIYLVQSMDVLTIQPLTAYLRDLKAKGILDQNKLKVVINKYTRLRGATERLIIGGMAFYNDPAMDYMTELFNRETIPYCTIPFDSQTYAKYLDELIDCKITIDGYSKEIINSLKKLANMVYPLISANSKNQPKYNNPKYNKFAEKRENGFSENINSTLDKMRGNY